VFSAELGGISSLKQLGCSTDDFEVDGRSQFPFEGGESAAIDRVNAYVWGRRKENAKWDRGAIVSYSLTRHKSIGTEYSTKWSPFLAHGCISPRWIYHSIRHFEARTGIKNRNTDFSVIVMMVFRDWMKFESIKWGDRIFYVGGPWGHSRYEPFNTAEWKAKGWCRDLELFRKWCHGQTGYPFIDAAMIELKRTGYLSFRWRLVVASFLIKDLGIDWRFGAEWFEALLVDYDCAMNYVNWCFVAGVGFDRGAPRKYWSQFRYAAMHDKEGKYVKLWIPRLKTVSKRYIHKPWLMGPTKQRINGCRMGTDYCFRCKEVEPPDARPQPAKGSRRGQIVEKFQIRQILGDLLDEPQPIRVDKRTI